MEQNFLQGSRTHEIDLIQSKIGNVYERYTNMSSVEIELHDILHECREGILQWPKEASLQLLWLMMTQANKTILKEEEKRYSCDIEAWWNSLTKDELKKLLAEVQEVLPYEVLLDPKITNLFVEIAIQAEMPEQAIEHLEETFLPENALCEEAAPSLFNIGWELYRKGKDGSTNYLLAASLLDPLFALFGLFLTEGTVHQILVKDIQNAIDLYADQESSYLPFEVLKSLSYYSCSQYDLALSSLKENHKNNIDIFSSYIDYTMIWITSKFEQQKVLWEREETDGSSFSETIHQAEEWIEKMIPSIKTISINLSRIFHSSWKNIVFDTVKLYYETKQNKISDFSKEAERLMERWIQGESLLYLYIELGLLPRFGKLKSVAEISFKSKLLVLIGSFMLTMSSAHSYANSSNKTDPPSKKSPLSSLFLPPASDLGNIQGNRKTYPNTAPCVRGPFSPPFTTYDHLFALLWDQEKRSVKESLESLINDLNKLNDAPSSHGTALSLAYAMMSTVEKKLNLSIHSNLFDRVRLPDPITITNNPLSMSREILPSSSPYDQFYRAVTFLQNAQKEVGSKQYKFLRQALTLLTPPAKDKNQEKDWIARKIKNNWFPKICMDGESGWEYPLYSEHAFYGLIPYLRGIIRARLGDELGAVKELELAITYLPNNPSHKTEQDIMDRINIILSILQPGRSIPYTLSNQANRIISINKLLLVKGTPATNLPTVITELRTLINSL